MSNSSWLEMVFAVGNLFVALGGLVWSVLCLLATLAMGVILLALGLGALVVVSLPALAIVLIFFIL